MYEKIFKRTLDIIVAAVLVFVTLPITIAVAIAIKIETPGPVFYRQKRTGRYGEQFTFLKFRSTPPHNSVYDTSKKDTFTEVGKFIRRYSLDELPQLLHVLSGKMSLIGPRAWIPEYYDHMNDNQRRRNDVVPGITGLAQARGRNAISINEKINNDLEYVENISLRQDIKVIYLTLSTMFEKDTLEIGKHGISDELDVLRNQHGDAAAEGGAS